MIFHLVYLYRCVKLRENRISFFYIIACIIFKVIDFISRNTRISTLEVVTVRHDQTQMQIPVTLYSRRKISTIIYVFTESNEEIILHISYLFPSAESVLIDSTTDVHSILPININYNHYIANICSLQLLTFQRDLDRESQSHLKRSQLTEEEDCSSYNRVDRYRWKGQLAVSEIQLSVAEQLQLKSQSGCRSSRMLIIIVL